jgi:hypothetical protein
MTDKESKMKFTVDIGEPYTEAETYMFTDSHVQWLQWLESLESSSSDFENYKVLTSGDIVEYFKNAKGFMTAPVALIDGKILQARSQTVNSIDDMKEYIDIENIYVYMIVDISGRKIKKSHQPEVTEMLLSGKLGVPIEGLLDEMYEDVIGYTIRYCDA